ncbi:MAG: hypothetical protein AB7V62_06055 [Thermoleophilia bacterium]
MGTTSGRGHRSRLTRAGAAAAALALAVAGAGLGASDDLTLVSLTAGGGPADGSASPWQSGPALSDDGRRVAFTSSADDLAPGTNQFFGNVALRDLDAGTTVLVSRATGASGAGGDGESFLPFIAAAAPVVVFSSEADNLAAGTADVTNVYARDLAAGTTVLVSRATGAAGAPADDASFGWAMSADGRIAVFTSDANNLDPAADDAVGNVYARDLVTGTTTLVSRADGLAGAGGDASSARPSISADGRLVAFESAADNLSAADDDDVTNLFVRDLVAHTTTVVTPPGADGNSHAPVLSADGRRVAFYSAARTLSDADADGALDVFVRDLATGTTTFVSRADGQDGAGGDAASTFPSISADGRHVTFLSNATNLSGADGDAVRDVFARDLVTGTTRLVSRAAGPNGAGADGNSFHRAALSADGRHVAFESLADNLSAAPNPLGHVFLRDVLGDPPTPAAPAPPSPPAAGAPLTPTTPRIVRCAGRRATIIGTPRRDVIHGTRRADVIATLAGNDVVHGRGGNDTICLGAGNDRATGGPGRDLILGGAGRDTLRGGPGRDRTLGGPARDTCRAERRTSC